MVVHSFKQCYLKIWLIEPCYIGITTLREPRPRAGLLIISVFQPFTYDSQRITIRGPASNIKCFKNIANL